MVETPARSTVDSRRDQMFPILTETEIARLQHFGELRRFRDGELLFATGQRGVGMFVVISGRVAVLRHDGLGHVTPIREQEPGGFIAELAHLSGRPALVDARAIGDVEALEIPPNNLRALMIAEAELGERILRALILRRVHLIETGAAGPILIGPRTSPDMIRLQGFLTRNGQPHTVLDPETDEDAQCLVARFSPSPDDFPLAVCPDGRVLRNPTEDALARCIGLLAEEALGRVFDIAIVGAGPAGLATAVYAASEGLSVIILETRAFGGQAGASARIENYLGFPTGISGQALAGRAFTQAQKFGAEFVIPLEVKNLDCAGPDDHLMALDMMDGWRIQARIVVVASGARYRRLNVANLADFEGRGVWYWASPIEARLCVNQEVVLVGGGNSAGQAAVFLADKVKKIYMLVRGKGLAETMSRYLIDRIAATPNIELLTETEIVGLNGSKETGLQAVRWRHNPTGQETGKPIRNVFLFIGAVPATQWLKECGVELDDKGFVKTGTDVVMPYKANGGGTTRARLETSMPGVFAIGDVRSGSVKRVGGAIGEGAAVVAQLHGVLSAQSADSPIPDAARQGA